MDNGLKDSRKSALVEFVECWKSLGILVWNPQVPDYDAQGRIHHHIYVFASN